jgi:glycerophosphoryl diester phosphodiesterase
MPENTIPAFLHALEFPVTTLELDVVVSADSQLVVSHEPWVNPDICLDPQGMPIKDKDKFSHNIYKLTVAEISGFDCGILGNPRFPDQKQLSARKPTLRDVVLSVRRHCDSLGRDFPMFNIELKSDPQSYDIFVPPPEKFVEIVLNEIAALDLTQYTVLQSFDLNILREIHRQDSDNIPVSYLSSKMRNLEAAIDKLGFVPAIYSPNYHLVNRKMIRYARDHQIRVIPWTVNRTKAMQRLIQCGVDGIITDYPDRIGELTP